MDDAEENTVRIHLENLTSSKADYRINAMRGLKPYLGRLLIVNKDLSNQVMQQLAKCLKDQNAVIRMNAILTFSPSSIEGAFTSLFIEPSSLLSIEKLLAADKNFGIEVIQQLASCLNDTDSLVRLYAIKVLSPPAILLVADSKPWGIKVIEQFASCLTDKDLMVRRAVIDGLVPFIKELPAVNQSCRIQLMMQFASCLGAQCERTRRFVIEAFSPFAKTSLLPLIEEFLAADNPLGLLLTNQLANCLTDADADIRITALHCLSILIKRFLTIDILKGFELM